MTDKMDSVVVVCCFLAFLLYYNTLDAGFVYDDSRAILANQDVLTSTPLSSLLQNDFWGTPLTHSGSHKSYRPLCTLTFRFNYALGGFRPAGYHLVNVFLHCGATALFVKLCRHLFGRLKRPGRGRGVGTLVAGTVFAAHPVHTEAVAGVVGRADVASCICFLLALLAYRTHVKYRDKRHCDTESEDTCCATAGTNSGNGASAVMVFSAEQWSCRERRRTSAYLYLGASVLFAVCAMLTKEQGITALVVCAIYDIVVHMRLGLVNFKHEFLKGRHRGLVESITCLFLSLVILLQVRLYIMGAQAPEFARSDNPTSHQPCFWTRALTFSYLPVFNLGLLLWPRWLSFDWSMEAIPTLRHVTDPRNLLTAAFYIALTKAVWLGARKATAGAGGSGNKVKPPCAVCNCDFRRGATCHNNNLPRNPSRASRNCRSSSTTSTTSSSSSSSSTISNSNGFTERQVALIGIALLTIPFLPATNLFFYVGFVIAERVLYIPSLGYCLLVGLGSHVLYTRWCSATRRRKMLFWAAVALMIAAFSARTLQRNRDWYNEENLYRSGIPINPPKAYGNLGNVLSSQGRVTEAEWAYKKALKFRSNMADVHYNLGILLQGQERYEEAIQSYKMAIQYRPRLALAHLNLGQILTKLGRTDEAVDVYQRCSELDGTGLKDPRTHEATKISALFHLGRIYADGGHFRQAVVVYKEAISKMPDYYQAQSLYNMLGEAYYRLRQYDEAERWYKAALQVKPDHVPAHLTYGKMLAKNKTRLLEAEQWFLRAKELAPNDSSVYQHFGQFLSELERHDEAAEHYLRAAELSPEEYEIVFNAANALRQAGHPHQAEKYYRMAVNLRPDDARSHMNLGAMLHVNGKYEEAEQSYLQALRWRPDDETTLTNLRKLHNLLTRLGVQASRNREQTRK